MGGDCFEQTAGYFVGIGVEEANPLQALDAAQLFQQQCQAIFQAEIFAIARCVLADERDFAHAGLRQSLGFGDDGLEAPRAKLTAKLRNDAEGAGMVATLGDFDISRIAGRGQDSRRAIVVEIVGQIGDSAVPGIALEAALFAAMIALGSGSAELRAKILNGLAVCGGAAIPAAARISLQLSGANYRVDLGNIPANLIAEPLDQTAGNHQALGRPPVLWRAISRMVSTDSCCALPINEQVLTTITSASSAAGVSSAPPCASMPIITSLSTRFLGQPRLTNPTLVGRVRDVAVVATAAEDSTIPTAEPPFGATLAAEAGRAPSLRDTVVARSAVVTEICFLVGTGS